MTVLFEVMKYLNNYFSMPNEMSGKIEVNGGVVDGIENHVAVGQFYIVEGSIFNDGCWKHGEEELIDEEFNGRIVPLAIPRDFLNLIDEIDEWQTKSGVAASSPFNSESFAGYSYSLGTNADGSARSWREAFGRRLAVWRKL